jgi:hypothetical protein
MSRPMGTSWRDDAPRFRQGGTLWAGGQVASYAIGYRSDSMIGQKP